MTRNATNAFEIQKIGKNSTSCRTMVKKLKKASRNRVNGANISGVAIN